MKTSDCASVRALQTTLRGEIETACVRAQTTLTRLHSSLEACDVVPVLDVEEVERCLAALRNSVANPEILTRNAR